MTNPQVAIDIVGNNLTDRGASAAEKRLGKLGQRATKIGENVGKVGDRGFASIIRTFAEVDRAANDTFGTRSVFGGLGRSFGAVNRLGSSLRSGLGRTTSSLGRVSAVGEEASAGLGSTAAAAGEAAAGMEGAEVAATGLAAALGPVVVVGAAVVATLGAAAAAGYKFASGWAASTAQMGRFAEMTGISTKNLQELQGAAERYGIDKNTANGAVGGFAQTVHDARYGRNNEALALMMRLGVKFRTGADGNLDYNAMLDDTADALARQKDPQTSLMIANRLGIGGLLPLLRKGSGNLRSETADVDKHGVMNSDTDVATATKFTRSAVLMSQMADRAKQAAQAWTAGKYNPILEKGVDLGRSATDGTLGRSIASAIGDGSVRFDRAISDKFVPASDKISQAADKMLQASGWRSGGRFSAKAVGSLARKGAQVYQDFLAMGKSPEEAAAWAASAVAESGGDPHKGQHGGGPGYGLFQWEKPRQAIFRKRYGKPMSQATRREQEEFALWEAAGGGMRAAQPWINSARGAGGKADAVTRYFEKPAKMDRDAADRSNIAEEIVRQFGPIPVTVEVHVKSDRPTSVKTTAGHSKAPAVSHAMVGGH